MHHMIFSGDKRERALIHALHSHLRGEVPAPSHQSSGLMTQARATIKQLAAEPTPGEPAPLQSPELMVVLQALLAELLGTRKRSDQERAELTIALYLAYELIDEIKKTIP